MEAGRKHFVAGLLLGVLGTLLLALLVALAIAWSGSYNVAASTGHTAGVRWWIDTTMHASVRLHAGDDDVAARLAAADVGAGAAEFKAMCEHCHGGPGVEPAGWSRGMLPRPPDLAEAAGEWRPDEIFWIVQHGLKYSGMPSFGETHDPAAMWNITAFVDRLPAMTPAEYRAFDAAGHQHGHGGASGEHGGEHGGDQRGMHPQGGGDDGGHRHDSDGHDQHHGQADDSGDDEAAAQAEPPRAPPAHDHH